MGNLLSAELIEMGFKGILLNRLLAYIIDEETMEKFKAFISLSALNGEVCTKPVLVHRFVAKMQEEISFANCNQFLTQYKAAETLQQKHFLLSKLFSQYTNPLTLKKVSIIFDAETDKLESLYHRVVDYRGKYKPHEILTLLEMTPSWS